MRLKEKNVPAYLAKQGKKLKVGYNKIAEELGYDLYKMYLDYECRSLMTFDASAGNPLEDEITCSTGND
ncbi:MAG: hypothetical protein MZV64_45445 [Ignavibacteriales bacterium]|nr:hypothetical protein [Ignavibacteriales bacterium]